MKAINGDLLVDANGVRKDPVILVDNDRIVEVGSKGDVSVPSDAEVIDASGKVLMPGLIDCHIHFEGYKPGTPYKLLDKFEARLIRSAVNEARSMLEAGFTSVMDAGGLVGLHVRNAIKEGVIPGPRVMAAGRYISVTSGHGDAHDLPLNWVKEGRPMGWWPADGRIADGVDECMRAVREQLREIVDFIKITAGGTGAASMIEPWWVPQYTLEEIKAMVHIAHSWRRRVMVHAHNSEAVKRSVMAGVDIITHCSNVDDDTIRLMGEHETMVVPTMSWTYIKNPETSFENIRRLYDGGINLALGTDTAGTPLSFGKNALELEVYVEKLKLEPLEAIKIGTLNGAKTMGIEDLGTLEPKKLADIIAVGENPLENIRSLQDEKNIKLVMKEGTIYKNTM